MSLEKMIGLHPGAGNGGDAIPALALAARHAMLCALFCTSCADACAAEDMPMADCIRTCSDCADICTATARLAVRRAGDNAEAMLRAQLETCIQACDACAVECDRHDHAHCHLCATMCRECADDCRRALATLQ
ncbi:MAG TPA: four-helix bundle copper-binding protein [Luteimonas sp.]|nr:four-helix bundle copper-binding protein [Luteimonas sp.]